ncbi:hypothetical protein D3C80_1638560 [compost metagenome]
MIGNSGIRLVQNYNGAMLPAFSGILTLPCSIGVPYPQPLYCTSFKNDTPIQKRHLHRQLVADDQSEIGTCAVLQLWNGDIGDMKPVIFQPVCSQIRLHQRLKCKVEHQL